MTSDIRGAGTDGVVFVTFAGDSGSAEEVKLSNGDVEAFSRGRTSTFPIKTKDVGSNKRITFRLVRVAQHAYTAVWWLRPEERVSLGCCTCV